MEPEQLAYEEAKRQIDRQSSILDGLRSRAGILLAAISVTTSFLGGQALAEHGFSTWAGLATAFFVGAGAACVTILWPTAKWTFDLSAAKILAQIERHERPSLGRDTTRARPPHSTQLQAERAAPGEPIRPLPSCLRATRPRDHLLDHRSRGLGGGVMSEEEQEQSAPEASPEPEPEPNWPDVSEEQTRSRDREPDEIER